MRKAAIISACVHGLVIALVYFGVPSLFRPKPVLDAPVSVELVAAIDRPSPVAQPAPPKPGPAPPPRVEQPPPAPPPLPREAVETSPPEAAPLPAEKPEPRLKPEPRPVAKPKPPPEPAVKVAAAPPAPRRKPRPPPDQFQTLLKNLEKQKQQAQRVEETEKKKPQKKPAPPGAEPFDAQKLVASLNAPAQRSSIDRRRQGSTLSAMVKQQVTPCWSIPGGAKDVQNMKIAVRIQLAPDGTLRGAPRIEDTRRMQVDPAYRAVAESTLRALRNPKCSPLRLPIDQYDIWKDITFLFEPGEALGQ